MAAEQLNETLHVVRESLRLLPVQCMTDAAIDRADRPRNLAGQPLLAGRDFVRLNFSADDFDGFPSSMIEGSYDHLGTRLHTYNRVVIPVTSTFERYLVQFTVTTLADQAAAAAADVQKVIEGFSVSVK